MAARNGIPLDQQPIVEVLDSDDQPVPQVQVSAAIASGGGTLSGTTAVVSDAAGRAAYSDLALVGPGGARTLRFSVTEPALEVVSGAIVVGAGAPAQIAGVAPLTYRGIVGSPVSPAPSVVVKDAAGNPVPGISVGFSANRDASVSPQTVNTDNSGVAQVTSWTLGTTATSEYTLTARVEGSALAAVTFSATARAGAAGRLSIATQPSGTTQNGAVFPQQPVIQVVDQNGNPAPQPDVQIKASIAAGTKGELQNATANTDATGRATFSGLTMTGTVGNYTISFSAEGLAGVMSNPVALTVGPAAQLAFAVTPPATARSRAQLAAPPVIQVQDASGNPAAQAGLPITASVGDGTLSGSATVNTGADGRATFTDLAIVGSPGAKTLTFSSTGLQAVSAQVTLPEVARIEVHPETPDSVTVGTTLTAVPIAILKDVAGQPVADAPFNLTPSSGSISVLPANGTSGEGGVVTADFWTLGTVTGDQDVVIKISETVPVLLIQIQGTAAAPDTLLKDSSGDNQSAPAGTDLALPLVVQVVDQYGNGVPDATVQWQACDGSVTSDPQTTDDQGKTSIVLHTGSQPGPSCVNAYSPGPDGPQLKGSPVTFNYTVTGPASMDQSTEIKKPLFKSQPGGSSRSRGVYR